MAEEINMGMTAEDFASLNGGASDTVKEEVSDDTEKTLEPIAKPVVETATEEELENIAEKGEEDIISDEEEDKKEGDANYAKLLADMLVENKILDSSEEIASFDDLTNAFRASDDVIIEDYVGSLPDNIKALINASNEGLNTETSRDAIMSLTELEKIGDTKDTDVLKDLMRRDLKSSGYGDDYITKRLEAAEDTDMLKLEGDIAKKRMIEEAKASLEREKADIEINKKERERAMAEWQEGVTQNVSTSLTDRYKLNKNLQADIVKNVIEPVRIVEENGYQRPVSFLEDAIQKDSTLLAELTYLILSERVGKEAKGAAKHSTTNAVKELEKAMKNGRNLVPKGVVQTRKSPLTQFKLS